MNRLTLLAVLAFSAGCSPKFLVSDYFIPDTAKVVRATVAQSGLSDDGGNTTVNYYLQVCDLQDGKATNCKSSLVLNNVVAADPAAVGGF